MLTHLAIFGILGHRIPPNMNLAGSSVKFTKISRSSYRYPGKTSKSHSSNFNTEVSSSNNMQRTYVKTVLTIGKAEDERIEDL